MVEGESKTSVSTFMQGAVQFLVCEIHTLMTHLNIYKEPPQAIKIKTSKSRKLRKKQN
jgi:hypothetical protein